MKTKVKPVTSYKKHLKTLTDKQLDRWLDIVQSQFKLCVPGKDDLVFQELQNKEAAAILERGRRF